MKKLLSLLSAFALISAVSCSSGEKSSVASLPMAEEKFAEDGRPVITVGNFGYVDDYLNNPLIKPQDYVVELVNYRNLVDKDSYDMTTGTGQQMYEDAISRAFDMELLQGNAPDILFTSAPDMRRLIDRGYMTDLFPLMEQYGGIQREDFTDCALAGLIIDGKLPAFMENYWIYTAVAKSKFVPEEYTNWTAADAMSFYEKMPQFGEDMEFTEIDLSDYMLEVEGMNCIDEVNAKCDFSGAFCDLLNFCKLNENTALSRPIDFASMDDADWDFYIKEQAYRGINDAQLVYPMTIQGFDNQLAQDAYGYFGYEDITFVGYPSEDGCGAYVHTVEPMVGICEQSANKELAWDLLNMMVKYRQRTPEYGNAPQNISVFKSEIDYFYDLYPSHNSSINGEKYAFDGSTYSLPQEVKDKLLDYILSIPANPYRSGSVGYIIDEECQPVINDTRTAEEAVKIITDRITTYLSERSN